MSENVVSKEVCNEKHNTIKDKFDVQDKRLNDHSNRLNTVEDAVIRLTLLYEQAKKRDVFDKILTVSVFVMCLVLLGIVLGPEITGKMINGIK